MPPALKAETDEGLETAQEMFLALLNDSEAEVKHATAMVAAQAAQVFNLRFVYSSIFPKVEKLVSDEATGPRNELAMVLLEMAEPLGPKYSKELFLDSGLIESLVIADPTNADAQVPTNLRLAVILKLAGVVSVLVGEGPDAESGSFDLAVPCFKIIRNLCGDKNWRVRHAALQLLTSVAPLMKPDVFFKFFLDTSDPAAPINPFSEFAKDNVSLIRVSWVEQCALIADLADYGSKWLMDCVLEHVTKSGAQKNYQLQAVLLHAASTFATIVPASYLVSTLLPPLLEMASNRVPNLRVMVAQSLKDLAERYKAAGAEIGDVSALKAFIRDHLDKELGTLCEDGDMDVAQAAAEAKAAIASSPLAA